MGDQAGTIESGELDTNPTEAPAEYIPPAAPAAPTGLAEGATEVPGRGNAEVVGNAPIPAPEASVNSGVAESVQQEATESGAGAYDGGTGITEEVTLQ